MKRIVILFCIFLMLSCKKVQETTAPPMPLNVGTLNVSPNPTNGQVTMSFLLESSIKYNLSLQGINNKVYKSYGISSESGFMEKSENFSNLPNGAYDLILIDISGRETKTPLIIQK